MQPGPQQQAAALLPAAVPAPLQGPHPRQQLHHTPRQPGTAAPGMTGASGSMHVPGPLQQGHSSAGGTAYRDLDLDLDQDLGQDLRMGHAHMHEAQAPASSGPGAGRLRMAHAPQPPGQRHPQAAPPGPHPPPPAHVPHGSVSAAATDEGYDAAAVMSSEMEIDPAPLFPPSPASHRAPPITSANALVPPHGHGSSSHRPHEPHGSHAAATAPDLAVHQHHDPHGSHSYSHSLVEPPAAAPVEARGVPSADDDGGSGAGEDDGGSGMPALAERLLRYLQAHLPGADAEALCHSVVDQGTAVALLVGSCSIMVLDGALAGHLPWAGCQQTRGS